MVYALRKSKIILSLILSFVFITAIGCIGAFATDGAYNDVSWVLDKSTDTLTLNGCSVTYELANYTGFGDYDIHNIKKIIIGSGIKEIDDFAFSNFTKIESFQLPSTLEKIGKMAFSGCTALTGITIPASVTEIGEMLFLGCTNLKNVETASSALLDYAFEQCPALDKLTVSAENIPDEFVTGTVKFENLVFTDNVKIIGKGAFSSLNALKNITFGKNVTEIGESAFSGCAFLENLNLPSSLKKIGNSAFSLCSSIESVTLPSSLESIAGGAFGGSGLKEVTVNTNTNFIFSDVFAFCSSLQKLTISSATVPADFINSTLYPGEVVLTNTVTEIGKNAFNAPISKITLSDNLKKSVTVLSEAPKSPKSVCPLL